MPPPSIYIKSCGGGKPPPYPKKCISCVGNGLDRSANLPIHWGGGTRKARDGGAKSHQNPRAGEHSSPLQPVGNDLSVVPQNYIEIYGRARRPAPTTGRRVVAPYARNIFFRIVACDSPVRGNVCYNRVGRGLAPAVFAPSDEGAVKCNAFDWGRDFSVSLPPSRLRRATSLVRGRNNGSSRRRPLRTHCHSEPLGEESRFVYFNFVLLAILRFAQDDKSPPTNPNFPRSARACNRRARGATNPNIVQNPLVKFINFSHFSS